MDDVNACCKARENRKLVSISTENETVRKHEKCGVCGRNHYLMINPPLNIGVRGEPLVSGAPNSSQAA